MIMLKIKLDSVYKVFSVLSSLNIYIEVVILFVLIVYGEVFYIFKSVDFIIWKVEVVNFNIFYRILV